jgi:hypothetical protein
MVPREGSYKMELMRYKEVIGTGRCKGGARVGSMDR